VPSANRLSPDYLTKPGQSQPYNWFPWAALAIYFANRRDPGLGEQAGSIVADE